jgi:Cu(I)/Ag(I) efflux system membrane fusion protein
MKRALIFVIVLAGLAAGGWAFNTRFQITPRATTTAANIAAAKQRWICRMDPQIIQDHPGLCPVCGMPLTPQDQAPASGELIRPATAPAKREILYYWDPMLGPSSISNKPGISSMGMDLVPVFKGDVSEGSTVVIDPAVVQNMGVRTALVTRGGLTRPRGRDA